MDIYEILGLNRKRICEMDKKFFGEKVVKPLHNNVTVPSWNITEAVKKEIEKERKLRREIYDRSYSYTSFSEQDNDRYIESGEIIIKLELLLIKGE